jgi:RecQ family ATP-dependent DNA helicase
MVSDTDNGLFELFGFRELRPAQRPVVQAVLDRQDVLAVMPTGSGKSLCYQYPATKLPGITLVISPLIALMKDQVDGLPASLRQVTARIDSTLPAGGVEQEMRALRAGERRLVYIAPERLRSKSFVDALSSLDVSLIVIDEAHCISLWGHDFRPDYLFVRHVLQGLPDARVLALTATATPEIQREIGERLGRQLQVFDSGVLRPNIRLSAVSCGERSRLPLLIDLARRAGGPVIVYVKSRDATERIAADLCSAGIKAAAYHARMPNGDRARVQDAFMRNDVQALVGTIAFGMGIDKPDVRMIVHWGPSTSLESYTQESGRAGRDGEPAEAVLLWDWSDKKRMERWLQRDQLHVDDLRALYRHIRELSHDGVCSATPLELTTSNNEEGLTKLMVSIGALEEAGLLGRDFDGPGRTLRLVLAPEFPAPVQQVLERREEAMQRRLKAVFDYASTSTCRHARISRHFGQPPPPSCDMCDNCLGEGQPQPLTEPRVTFREFSDEPSTSIRPQPAEAPADPELLARLKAWRRERAATLNMPAFVIASDRSLQSIAAVQPKTLVELTACYGFGKLKAEQWGGPILEIVREWRNAGSDTSASDDGEAEPPQPHAEAPDLQSRLAELDAYLAEVRAGFRLDEVTRHDLLIHNPGTITGLLKVRGIGPRRALEHGEKVLSALHGRPFVFSNQERDWLQRLEALYADYPRETRAEGEPLTPNPAPEGSREQAELRGLRLSASRELRIRAQELRDQQTTAEAALWERLRARRLDGLKFRRQHALGRYIVDFYCVEKRLAVEVDGGIHEDTPDRDVEREAWLANHAVSVVRITNDEVERRLGEALDRIRTAASSARDHARQTDD